MQSVVHFLDHRRNPLGDQIEHILPHAIDQPFARKRLILHEPKRSEYRAILKPCRFLGNDLIVFHVLDPQEIAFDYKDASAFEDLESREQIPVVPDSFRKQYRALIQAHVDTLRQKFSEQRIDYALLIVNRFREELATGMAVPDAVATTVNTAVAGVRDSSCYKVFDHPMEACRGAHLVRDYEHDVTHPTCPLGRNDAEWMKHTLWHSANNSLTYKPVNLKPMTVESVPPKVRTF